MNEQAPELLIRPQRDGIRAVTIRRSALLAAGLALAIVVVLSLLLFRSNRPGGAVAALPAARAADPSVINERIVRTGDALTLPTTLPAPVPRADSALVASDSLAPPAPILPLPRPAVALQPPSGATVIPGAPRRSLSTSAEQPKDPAAALNADLEVKLDVSDSATPNSGEVLAPTSMQRADSDDSARECACVLERGAVIPASLYTSIDSTVAGTITAQVRRDVFDSTHHSLLIPSGSRLVGKYASTMSSGQARLFAAFDSVKLPNGRTIDLGSMPGADLQGVTGLGGDTDFHTGRIFGNIALLSIFAAATQLTQSRGSGTSVVINGAGQGTQQASTMGSEVVGHYLNQQPTMHTPAGFILNVTVERDLRLSAYAEQRPP